MHSYANNRHRHIVLVELVSNNAPPPHNLANLHPQRVSTTSFHEKLLERTLNTPYACSPYTPILPSSPLFPRLAKNAGDVSCCARLEYTSRTVLNDGGARPSRRYTSFTSSRPTARLYSSGCLYATNPVENASAPRPRIHPKRTHSQVSFQPSRRRAPGPSARLTKHVQRSPAQTPARPAPSWRFRRWRS